MKRLSLSEIARLTGGRLHGADADVDVVCTDTRGLPAQGAALFVAPQGRRSAGRGHVAGVARHAAAAAPGAGGGPDPEPARLSPTCRRGARGTPPRGARRAAGRGAAPAVRRPRRGGGG